MKKSLFLALLIILLYSLMPVIAQQNETMVVEANIFASENPEDIVSIEVPDYIFLGNVSKSESTDKTKVYVNNTGTVNVTITPVLRNTGNEIFQNIFFQNRQSGDNSAIFRIGGYSFNIEKPSAVGGKRSEYFWMWLDLTNFDGEIFQDIIGAREEITFVALPQS